MRSASAVTGVTTAPTAWRRGAPAARARAALAVLLVPAVAVLAGCGTAPSGSTGAAAETAPTGAGAAPGADDPSLPTVDPPQLSTLDAAAARTTAGPATATGADGLTLTVLGAACGLPGVRSDGYAASAQGQVCLVQVQVVNLTAELHGFSPDRTALLVAEGQQQARPVPPSEAAAALPALVGMDAQLPPSTTLTGAIAYDVPVGATAREITLDQGRADLP